MSGSSNSFEKWGCIGSLATAIATVIAAIIGGAFLLYANNRNPSSGGQIPVTIIIPTVNVPATSPPPTQNTTADLNIVNNGTQDICYVYIALSTSGEWGGDWLGSEETIQPGGSRVFNVPAGEYNIRASNCDELVIQESRNSTLQGDMNWYVDRTIPVSTIAESTDAVSDIAINVEHNVYQSDRKGMLIKVTFDVSGYKDVPSQAVAYFETQSGEPLKNLDDDFETTAGNVCAYTDFQPDYEDTTYTDLEIFMPYDELHVDTTSELRFYISLYDKSKDEFFGSSDYFDFSITY